MKTDRPEPADDEPGGPTEEPYPTGSRPAGPDAEAMAPEQFMAGGELGSMNDIPLALSRITEIRARLRSHPAVILEYDGLVDQLAGDGKTILGELADQVPVAVVGNRPTTELQSRVGVDSVTCVGTDRPTSDGELDTVEQRLLAAAADVEGVGVERTPQAVAVRVPRSAPDASHARAHDMVAQVLDEFASLTLHTTNGIHELRPASDRTAVVTQLLSMLDATALYVGPGEPAEPAFRVIRARGGIGVVVSPEAAEDRSTWAEYRLADPGEIEEFLSRLTQSLAGDLNP